MNNMYDILATMKLLESRGSKPDFLDLDKDGDRKEPMKQAAKQQVKELAPLAAMALRGAASAVASSLTDSERGHKVAGQAKQDDMDESALQAHIGKKKYGEEGMKALQQAGRDGAGSDKMAKIRARHDKMDEAEVDEGNDFVKARLDAIRAGKPTFRMGEKVYRVTGDTSDEQRMDEGLVDFMDKKAKYRDIGAEVEGRADDYTVTFRDGTRKRYQEIAGSRRVTTLEPVDAAEPQDDEGNVVQRGRGRPKGSKRAIGAKGPTGRSKLLRMSEDDNGIRDDLAYEIEQILDGAIEGTDQTDHIIDELGDLYDRIESSGDKVALKAYSMMNGSIDQGTNAQVRAAQMALKRLKQGMSEGITALAEGHFAVGDKVRCKKSGMTGEIIKMDKAHGDQDEKYYTFRRSDGKVIKKAPSELTAVANEDYDRDEYDEEGEMAKSQARTIENAAEELQSILADDENLPEWVQVKITLALDYIDTARDYMKANRPDNGMMAEKAVSRAQRAAAGIARAAQKGEIPRSELQPASRAMADMPAKELRKFAKTKERGLPDKVKEEDLDEVSKSKLGGYVRKAMDDEQQTRKQADASGKSSKEAGKGFMKDRQDVLTRQADKRKTGIDRAITKLSKEDVDETTVSGSVATSDAAPKSNKGGMQFGKGVYESQIAESFERKLTMLTEGMNINMSMDEHGKKSLTVNATDEDAEQLADILKMAGLGGHAASSVCGVCGGRGMHEHGCDQQDMMEHELANSPDPSYAALGGTRDYGLAGGVNGPKLQSNPNNPGDNPLAMSRMGKHAGPSLNLGAVVEDIKQQTHTRLMDLYKSIS